MALQIVPGPSCSYLNSRIKKPWLFIREYLEIKIWLLDFIATAVSLLLGPLPNRARKYMCAFNIHISIYLSIHLFIYLKPWVHTDTSGFFWV